MKHYLWVFVLIGIWFIIAPFIWGYSHEAAPLWNDIAGGAIVTIVGLLAYSKEEENKP